MQASAMHPIIAVAAPAVCASESAGWRFPESGHCLLSSKKTYAAFFIIQHKQGICLWRQRCVRKCGRMIISAAWPAPEKDPLEPLAA
jgi:hypothetical protein